MGHIITSAVTMGIMAEVFGEEVANEWWGLLGCELPYPPGAIACPTYREVCDDEAWGAGEGKHKDTPEAQYLAYSAFVKGKPINPNAKLPKSFGDLFIELDKIGKPSNQSRWEYDN